MKRAPILLSLLLIVPVLAWAKPTSTDRKLDTKLTEVEFVRDSIDLQMEITKEFREVHGLDEQTKNQLRTLRTKTLEIDRTFETQVFRLKAVLVQDLLADEFDKNEMNLIKKRMRDIAEKRISLIFDAAAAAHKILGESAKEHKKIFDDYFHLNLANRS